MKPPNADWLDVQTDVNFERAALEQAAFDEGYEAGIRASFPPLFTLLLVAFVTAIVVGLFTWIVVAPVVSASAPRSAASVILGEPAGATTENLTPPSGAPRAGMPVEARADAGGEAPAPAGDVGAPPDSAAATFGGTATWYCSATSPCTRGYGPSDLVAAIDPSTGIGKGAQLRVHFEGRSVEVTVVDVCACGGDNVIDLTSGAFLELAPLSAGRIPVAIEVLGADVTPPATSTEP